MEVGAANGMVMASELSAENILMAFAPRSATRIRPAESTSKSAAKTSFAVLGGVGHRGEAAGIRARDLAHAFTFRAENGNLIRRRGCYEVSARGIALERDQSRANVGKHAGARADFEFRILTGSGREKDGGHQARKQSGAKGELEAAGHFLRTPVFGVQLRDARRARGVAWRRVLRCEK